MHGLLVFTKLQIFQFFQFLNVIWGYNCVVFGCGPDSGGVLHGPGLSFGFCLPPLQNPQSRMSRSAWTLSRSSVCSKVRAAVMDSHYFLFHFFVPFFKASLFFTVTSCEWILQMQTRCMFEACVFIMRTASIKRCSSLSRLWKWHLTMKKPDWPAG